VALHGVCYDFFFVTGYMYTDQKAPTAIRGQAQSLLVFLTQGIGMFFGYKIMGGDSFLGIPLKMTIAGYGGQVTKATEYTAALKEAAGEPEAMSFFATFANMLSRSLPEGLDKEVLASTMAQWKNFWMFPAIMAAAILVVFTLTFWEKTKSASEAGSDSSPDGDAAKS
jgi:hypothetical protein